MNKSEILFRKMIREIAEPMLTEELNEAKYNISKMYPNSTDLERDIVAWYRSLKKDVSEKYAKEMRADLVKVLMKEGKLNEAKLRKGDYVGVDDEIGVVNKVKGRVAYIKLKSMPGSFHPIEAERAKYKGKFKGKDLYIAEGKLNEVDRRLSNSQWEALEN